jgi:rRNA small subunit pseudouridine methyltransferase Nep1
MPTEMKLNVILAESALELIPRELWRDSSVVSDSRKRGVEPSRILLDRSFHHRAMLNLKDGEMRGRPDLIHITLLNITGTPLYLDGTTKIYIHTRNDAVVGVEERTRIPKSYFRFRGLMEQVLLERPSTGLLGVSAADVADLVESIESDRVIGLTTLGRDMPMDELATTISAAKNPSVVIGGFPRGHFSRKTSEAIDELVRIDERHLDAHVVASRVIYEVEKRTRTND